MTAQGTVFSNNREVYSSYGAFVNRTVVCQGYALSLKVLLDRANVPCRYVLANTDTLHHTWDLVQLDGTWYHVDTTWDDPPFSE